MLDRLALARKILGGRRWWPYGRSSLCPISHQVGPVTVRHDEVISCRVAGMVADAALVVWEMLDPYFPGLPVRDRRFTLFVITDPRYGYGFHRGRAVVVNLHSLRVLGDVVETLVHELFHLRCFLVGIHYETVFAVPSGVVSSRGDLVRFYAVNPGEYAALRCVVELTGAKADLLAEVEEYRYEHGIG